MEATSGIEEPETRIQLLESEIARTREQIEKLKQEKRLQKESEAKYRLLVEKANDSIFILQDGLIKYHNRKTEEIIGYSADELRTIPFVNHIAADDQEGGIANYLAMLNGETCDENHAYRIIHRSGSELWAELNCIRVDWEGSPAVLVTARDLTFQKKMECQLSQAQKMEAIGTLAGGIAHDFNNILGALIAYTEASLHIVPEKSSQLRSNLTQVLTAGQRAKDLVSQILAFSRQTDQEQQIVQLESIVNESLKLLRASIPATIEIRTQITPGLGPIRAYPTQVHQVLMNLCSNASHAMRENGGVLDIQVVLVQLGAAEAARLTPLKPGRYIRLSVSDTGCGMDAAVVNQIFNPYFTTKERGEGTGLGLAVVQEIVNRHNGSIVVDSKPGRGTVFHVFLPENPGTTEEPADVQTLAPKNGNEHILLVDDEKILVDALGQMLESAGYRVTTRTDSEDALKTFETCPDAFDLLITDQTMPRLTGKHLASRMMEIRPDLPVILSTGFSDVVDREDAAAAGIREFIMKPFKFNDLSSRIRKVLDNRP